MGQESLTHRITKFPAALVFGGLFAYGAHELFDHSILVAAFEGVGIAALVTWINWMSAPREDRVPKVTSMGQFVI